MASDPTKSQISIMIESGGGGGPATANQLTGGEGRAETKPSGHGLSFKLYFIHSTCLPSVAPNIHSSLLSGNTPRTSVYYVFIIYNSSTVCWQSTRADSSSQAGEMPDYIPRLPEKKQD